MKTSYLYIKISLIFLFFFISISSLSALSFPSGYPTGQVQNGKIQGTLTNILSDCGAGRYIQGWDGNGVADCKSVASFSSLLLASGNSNTTSGSGLFQRYFAKILNNCGNGRYVRGFDANKNLICENATPAVTLMGTAISLASPVSASSPPTPALQVTGGAFTDSFTQIFAAGCGTGEYLQGFNTTTKAPICAPLVTMIGISTCVQLQNIGTNVTTLSGIYRLTSDIDCSDTVNWNGGLGFKPIGLVTKPHLWYGTLTYIDGSDPFTGTLDGNGYKITHLYINRPTVAYVGLFNTTDGANIKNIGLDGANIPGGGFVGGLVGYGTNGTIINSYVIDSILKGNTFVGGMVGYGTNGTIINSYVINNNIIGQSYVGSIAGSISTVSVTNSYATNNTVTGTNMTGGFIGMSHKASVDGSYASNNTVNGSNITGGFIGYSQMDTITNSYSANNTVNGSNITGGFIGNPGTSSAINSYSANSINGGTSSNVGGLIGGGNISLTSSFYNKDSFTGTTLHGTPKTTEEMVLKGTYTGWDFSSTWKPMTGALTGYYPCLAWQSNGTCTKAPNMISTCAELQAIGNNATTLAGKYQLISDVDCSETVNWNGGLGFYSIGLVKKSYLSNGIPQYYDGSEPFTGTLDGKGHKITGLYINRPSTYYVGLLSSTKGAIIKNIHIEGAYIKGSCNVGGLVGGNYNSSPITNSSVTNSKILGSIYVGGLIGTNDFNYGTISYSPISNSHVTNNVIGGTGSSTYLGGLAGSNRYAPISNSYASNNTIGGVNSNTYVGGLAGTNYNSSPISNSYATNNIIGGGNINTYAGGLAGANYTSPISNSYATNNIIGGGNINTNAGGLTGAGGASPIVNSYAANKIITGSSSSTSAVGLAAYDLGSASSYYNADTFTGTLVNGVGKTTAEMVLPGTYTGWDFGSTWKQVGAGYYPCLAWQSDSTCIKP